MSWLVGIILVGMALFSVSAVLFMVLREHQETEEWYIPPAPGSEPAQEADESGG